MISRRGFLQVGGASAVAGTLAACGIPGTQSSGLGGQAWRDEIRKFWDTHHKTGTLNFVCALTGYLTTATGRELAFAILTSDLARRATLTEAERDSPPGGKAWAGRSRALQRRLLAGWAVTHA